MCGRLDVNFWMSSHQDRSTAQDSMCTRECTRACRLANVPPFPSRFIFLGSTSCTCHTSNNAFRNLH